MKYKIFIKTILTVTLLNNSCALVAMEYVRKDAPEETPKKDTPTAQGQMVRPAPLVAPKQPSQTQSKQPTSSPQVTQKQRQVESTEESRRLDAAVASVPDPLTVRDRAAAREAASEAEAEKARYLPAAGLGLPTRVPTLVAPTMPAKPLGEGVSPLTTPKLKPSTQPEKEPEEVTRKQTEALEQQEAIKKQTADLIARGLSPAEADFLMKMPPISRAETIKKLEENQALKPAQPKPVTEAQRPVAEPATTQKPVTQPLIQIADIEVARQIEEIARTKEVLNLSEEQKALAASLGDSAIDAVAKMTEAEIKLLPAEDRLKLFQIITARGMLINAAKISIERQEEIRAKFLANPANKGKPFPETTESMRKETQEKFAFSTEIPRSGMAPEDIAKNRIIAVTSAVEKANAILQRLGTDTEVRLGALTQIKNQIDVLSKKTNLTIAEKQTLKTAINKYISSYLDVSQNAVPSKRASDAQKKHLDTEFGNFVSRNPEAVRAFLVIQEENEKKIRKQLGDSNAQLVNILSTKKVRAAMKKANALTKQVDAMEPKIDKMEKKKKEIEKKIEEDGKRLGPKKVAALARDLEKINKNIEKAKQKRIALSNESRRLMDTPGKKPLEDKIRRSQVAQKELQQQIGFIRTALTEQ
ncbi:MAG: hypothetical protein V1646_01880 [bacterium]